MKKVFVFLVLFFVVFSCKKPVPAPPVQNKVSLQNCKEFSGVYVSTSDNSGRIVGVNACNTATGVYCQVNAVNIDFSNGTLAAPITSGISSDTLFIKCVLANGVLTKSFKKSSYDDVYTISDSCSAVKMSVDTASVYSLINFKIN